MEQEIDRVTNALKFFSQSLVSDTPQVSRGSSVTHHGTMEPRLSPRQQQTGDVRGTSDLTPRSELHFVPKSERSGVSPQQTKHTNIDKGLTSMSATALASTALISSASEDQRKEVVDSLHSLVQNLQDELNRRDAELQSVRSSMNAQITKLTAAVESERLQHRSAIMEKEAKHRSTQALQDELESRNQTIVQLREDIREQDRVVVDLRRELQSKSHELLQYQEEVHQKSSAMSSAISEKNVRESKISELNRELDEFRQVLHQMKGEVERRERSISQLKSEQDHRDRRIEQLEADLQTARHNTELAGSWEDKLKDRDRVIIERDSVIERMRREIETNRQRAFENESRYEEQLREKGTEISERSQQLSNIQRDLNLLRSEEQAAIAERESLIRDKDSQILSLKQEVENLRQGMTESQRANDTVLRQKDKTITELHNDIANRSSSVNRERDLELQVEQQRQENATLREKLNQEQLNSRHLESLAKSGDQSSKIEHLEKQVRDLTAKLHDGVVTRTTIDSPRARIESPRRRVSGSVRSEPSSPVRGRYPQGILRRPTDTADAFLAPRLQPGATSGPPSPRRLSPERGSHSPLLHRQTIPAPSLSSRQAISSTGQSILPYSAPVVSPRTVLKPASDYLRSPQEHRRALIPQPSRPASVDVGLSSWSSMNTTPLMMQDERQTADFMRYRQSHEQIVNDPGGSRRKNWKNTVKGKIKKISGKVIFDEQDREVFRRRLLSEASFLQTFYGYLQEYGKEYALKFWLEVEDFKQADQAALRLRAQRLYDKYLRKGARMEIQVEDNWRSVTYQRLQSATDKDVDSQMFTQFQEVMFKKLLEYYDMYLRSSEGRHLNTVEPDERLGARDVTHGSLNAERLREFYVK